MVYLSAAFFLLSVFPIYVSNYIFIDTEEKYASLNVTAFRFIRLFNLNTVKDKPNEIQLNGKNREMDFSSIKLNFYKIFNKICIYKVIQLSDFGLKNQNNAYAALAQSAATTTAYKFLQINGNYSKLRNYIVLNEEHSAIRYYAKTVTIINLFVISKIIMILIMEKLHEIKKK